MYFPNFFKILDREKIAKEIKNEGFNPIPITNSPGFVYSLHQHPETKLLVFLKGEMDVLTQGRSYHCLPGDKIIIPGNTPHKAVVGKNGCTFFWSEKIL